jgi:SAM-dependent methyltransferase
MKLQRIFETVRAILKPKQSFEFDQYVQYWIETAKNPKALDVSTEVVGSNRWLALAEGQLQLLKLAGLRNDWVIVEIGFGNGKIPYVLERNGAIPNGAYYGFDIIQRDIEFCQREFASKNFHFKLIEKNSLELPKEFADCVLLMSVFTHVDEMTMRDYLRQIYEVLKPTGLCMFSIHLNPPGKRGLRSIRIVQYSSDEIREIVSGLGFWCYKLASAPDPTSSKYIPGQSLDGPYGAQFVFVVSKKPLANPELKPL